VLQTGAAMAALSIQTDAVGAADYAIALAPEIVGAGSASACYLIAAILAAVLAIKTGTRGRHDGPWRVGQWAFLVTVLGGVLWLLGDLIGGANTLVSLAVLAVCFGLLVQGFAGWRRPVDSPFIGRDAGLRLVVILGTVGCVGFVSDVNTLFGKALHFSTMVSEAPELVNDALSILHRPGEHLAAFAQVTQPGMILLAVGSLILLGPAWVRAHISNRHLVGVTLILATLLTLAVTQGGSKQTVEDGFRVVAVAVPRPFRDLPASSSDLDPADLPILRVDGEGILWRDQPVKEQDLGALLREAGPSALILSTDEALSAERLVRTLTVCAVSGVGRVDLLAVRYGTSDQRAVLTLKLTQPTASDAADDGGVDPTAFVARVELRADGLRSCAGAACTEHDDLGSLQRTLLVVGGSERVRLAVGPGVIVQRLVDVIDHLNRIDRPDAGSRVLYPEVLIEREVLE
jgi:hypothetical protein